MPGRFARLVPGPPEPDVITGGRGPWIQTFTGRRFYLTAPRPGDVEIEDVAHSLGHLCRYNGHCRKFFSVAEHSVLCAELAERRGHAPRIALLALLHDAAEAYVGDATRPMKEAGATPEGLEGAILDAILFRYDIPVAGPDEHGLVKQLDNVLLATEGRALFAATQDWFLPEPPDDATAIIGWPPSRAKAEFLRAWRILRVAVFEDQG